MKHEIKVPNVGESITEVFIGAWMIKSGALVKKDQVLVDLETQKTSFELHAEVAGKLEILFPEPDTKVKPGDVIATIDDSFAREKEIKEEKEKKPVGKEKEKEKEREKEKKAPEISSGPAAKKIAEEKGIDIAILKEGEREPETPAAKTFSKVEAEPAEVQEYSLDESRGERREAASRIRRTIAANLVRAQRTAAILTTFNEADMSGVMEFRKKHKEDFKKKHSVSLSIISFFARATIRAIKEFPMVNATFTGNDIIHRDFVDLGIAVSTDSGLVVPVIRDAERLSLVEFEKKLAEITEKARSKKLSIDEMSGGTFTISNGGVFGSLLSTPILNLPQSAILGLHKIEERPVVVKGEIAIRPMMYLALSYDHRIIDGREAVSFLVKIKEGIEDLYHIVGDADLD